MKVRAAVLAATMAVLLATAGCHIEKVPVTLGAALPVPTEQEIADSFQAVACTPGESDEYAVMFDSATNPLHILINELGIDWVRVFDASDGSLFNVYPVSYDIAGEGDHFHVVLLAGQYYFSWVDGPWNNAPNEMLCPAGGPLFVR